MGKKRIITKSADNIVSAGQKSSSESKISKYQIEKGRVYIKCSYNNTIITLTDLNGNVIAYTSAGALGFPGP